MDITKYQGVKIRTSWIIALKFISRTAKLEDTQFNVICREYMDSDEEKPQTHTKQLSSAHWFLK